MRLKLLGISLLLILLILYKFAFAIAFDKLDKTITKLSQCPEEVLASLSEVKTQAYPYQIILNPWYGRHHVHGIFMLPVANNSSNKMLVISVPGAGTFCGGAFNYNVGNSFYGIQAKPGYYLLKANFRTRTSIWLIARGYANELKDSRNWRLINY